MGSGSARLGRAGRRLEVRLSVPGLLGAISPLRSEFALRRGARGMRSVRGSRDARPEQKVGLVYPPQKPTGIEKSYSQGKGRRRGGWRDGRQGWEEERRERATERIAGRWFGRFVSDVEAVLAQPSALGRAVRRLASDAFWLWFHGSECRWRFAQALRISPPLWWLGSPPAGALWRRPGANLVIVVLVMACRRHGLAQPFGGSLSGDGDPFDRRG